MGLIIVLIFVSLSYWQYSRHVEKSLLNINKVHDSNYNILEIKDINKLQTNAKIKIDNELSLIKTFFIRSRVHNGQSGYHLVEIREDNNSYLVIKRGWISIENETVKSLEYNPTYYHGVLKSFDSKPGIGQDDIPNSDYLFRIHKEFIESELELKLLDYYLQLTEKCGGEVTV